MKRILAAAALLLASVMPVQAEVISKPGLFFDRLKPLCGKAYEGRVVTTDAADKDFAGKRLVMRVADCGTDTVRIPFSVGEDRSRTWVITRLSDVRLRLKHDHRHEDGKEDTLSQYGGDTLGPESWTRVEFPADAFSKTLFLEKGNPASVDNVWALELTDRVFAYELRRPNRHFRVEFDLTRPLP
jgi:hypothetical protein